MSLTVATHAHGVAEICLSIGEPADRLEVAVTVTAPDGSTLRVPAFWAGGTTWKARYSSGQVGVHAFRWEGTDERGTITISPYRGENPLFLHGPVRVEGRHFCHEDGTPFFWLADTWWHAGTGRFRWPDVFLDLLTDRVKKGFSVIQLVAGMSCETLPFTPAMANEGGFPWDPKWTAVNPAWFDALDRKVALLVETGIVPCIVGSWGYWLGIAGEDVLRRHWDYVLARYAAYPVVWCLAGETSLPGYEEVMRPDAEELFSRQRERWGAIAKEVRARDPYRRPLTTHPVPGHTDRGSNEVDPALLDFDMLQTGHGDHQSSDHALATLRAAVDRGTMPVVNGEPSYEGIFGGSWANTQRFLFWTHLLSGAAGHSYGTLGIAVFTSGEDDYIGTTRCSDHTWRECRDMAGSTHLGLGRRLLETLDWQGLEPHPEWIEPSWAEGDNGLPYAAGVPGGIRLFYFPPLTFRRCVFGWPTNAKRVVLTGLDLPHYSAEWFDPRHGTVRPAGVVTPVGGRHEMHAGIAVSAAPTGEDWLLILRPEVET